MVKGKDSLFAQMRSILLVEGSNIEKQDPEGWVSESYWAFGCRKSLA
jgi:hypothetical protein